MNLTEEVMADRINNAPYDVVVLERARQTDVESIAYAVIVGIDDNGKGIGTGSVLIAYRENTAFPVDIRHLFGTYNEVIRIKDKLEGGEDMTEEDKVSLTRFLLFYMYTPELIDERRYEIDTSLTDIVSGSQFSMQTLSHLYCQTASRMIWDLIVPYLHRDDKDKWRLNIEPSL